VKVLLIPRKDVEGIATMKEIMEVVEDAFRAKGLGEVQMPPKVYVNFPNGDFRVMLAMCQSLVLVELKSLTFIQKTLKNISYLL
jgi:ornithine cyclodeaminase/alanine dehydrogenase-like protein (mu-crystallin family)